MRFWQNIVFILIILVLFCLPTRDTDFGWHYQCGLDWLQTGQFCFQNRYSYLLPDYFWGYSTWLYDVLLALIFNNAGFIGVAFALGLLMAVLAWLFFVVFKHSRTVVYSFLVFILFSSNVIVIGFRPQVVALVCFMLWLTTIRRIAKVDKFKSAFYLNLVLSLIMVFWVNLHPSFIIGLVIYGILVIVKLFKRQPAYMFSLGIIFLASLVSPLHINVYFELLNHYVTDLSKLIAEWTAPAYWQRVLIITSFITVLYDQLRSYKKKSALTWFYLISLFFLASLAISAKRHLPLYGLFLAFMLEEKSLLHKFLAKISIPESTLKLSTYLVLILFAILNLASLFQIKDFHKHYCQQALVKLPCEIERYQSLLQGNLFTMYEWGGYFIWQLPKAKVFVDGRMPAWQTPSGQSPYTIYLEIIQAKPGWQDTLNKHKTTAIVIQPGTFLDIELQNKPTVNWQEVVRNQNLVIYKKGRFNPGFDKF